MKYIGPDFYISTDLLTEEELLIQQTAYDFVQEKFILLIIGQKITGLNTID